MSFLVVRTSCGARAVNLDNVLDVTASRDGKFITFYSAPVGIPAEDGTGSVEQARIEFTDDEALAVVSTLGLQATDADVIDVALVEPGRVELRELDGGGWDASTLAKVQP